MGLKFHKFGSETAELAALEHLEKFHYLQWEKCFDNSGDFSFEQNFFLLAGIKDNHKSLDEFEFQAEPTSDCGVKYP